MQFLSAMADRIRTVNVGGALSSKLIIPRDRIGRAAA